MSETNPVTVPAGAAAEVEGVGGYFWRVDSSEVGEKEDLAEQ